MDHSTIESAYAPFAAVPAIIRDGDGIVNDGPIPIGRFIEGNASFHLDLHFEQLKALRS
jgi:hypothetical protein